ncbi:hypothetical protein NBCG_03557 [Nocardioidaceae bacterium Broad-1]|nr:hypothetical protein NBCG_03557 [Nocardioidaceae bacterium Broad-1]
MIEIERRPLTEREWSVLAKNMRRALRVPVLLFAVITIV